MGLRAPRARSNRQRAADLARPRAAPVPGRSGRGSLRAPPSTRRGRSPLSWRAGTRRARKACSIAEPWACAQAACSRLAPAARPATRGGRPPPSDRGRAPIGLGKEATQPQAKIESKWGALVVFVPEAPPRALQKLPVSKTGNSSRGCQGRRTPTASPRTQGRPARVRERPPRGGTSPERLRLSSRPLPRSTSPGPAIARGSRCVLRMGTPLITGTYGTVGLAHTSRRRSQSSSAACHQAPHRPMPRSVPTPVWPSVPVARPIGADPEKALLPPRSALSHGGRNPAPKSGAISVVVSCGTAVKDAKLSRWATRPESLAAT